MAHALLAWETLDKYQIDTLMEGRIIAPPEPVVDINRTTLSKTTLNDGENNKNQLEKPLIEAH